MKRILAAADGSAASLMAVALAAEMAAKFDAELLLLTVGRTLSARLTAELDAYIRQEQIDLPLDELGSLPTDSILAGAREEARQHGATRIALRSSRGDAAAEIIALADGYDADLIVVGSRGHGRLAGSCSAALRRGSWPRRPARCWSCADGLPAPGFARAPVRLRARCG